MPKLSRDEVLEDEDTDNVPIVFFYLNVLHQPSPSASPPAKKSKPSASKVVALENEQGETYFNLAQKRRLTVRKWKNSKLVDIREYWTDPEGIEKPGKKGSDVSGNTC